MLCAEHEYSCKASVSVYLLMFPKSGAKVFNFNVHAFLEDSLVFALIILVIFDADSKFSICFHITFRRHPAGVIRSL